ncbi:Metallophosphoesterase MPPED2 [Hondaea fermentalgiana]|uniref:Metallophosphoesterase MPPED2 n=1 Tax=Hondaea fermentalgiana TaxID=2315210 RepID=A0A2R5G698_9STRA|nr:Metallophosphoesterase MPPED2 [Hondaea fermentalgiana]|eukprot:GBG25308.1 Metallophosphoesterase MPPED2 [Hondaea fermentalgiana]
MQTHNPITMRFVILSESHCQHEELWSLSDGDVLVHAGEFCSAGGVEEARQFVAWMVSQPHRHKVLVAGNHDTIFDPSHAHAREYVRSGGESFITKDELLNRGIHYLFDAAVELDGVKVYGLPFIRAGFPSLWAFPIRSDGHAKSIWGEIPTGTDVLVTHSPPFGIRDRVLDERNIGCPILRQEVLERVRPALYVFGHCLTPGRIQCDETTFVNASWPTVPDLATGNDSGVATFDLQPI